MKSNNILSTTPRPQGRKGQDLPLPHGILHMETYMFPLELTLVHNSQTTRSQRKGSASQEAS